MTAMRVPGYRWVDLSSQVTEHDSGANLRLTAPPDYLPIRAQNGCTLGYNDRFITLGVGPSALLALTRLYQCSNHLSNCAGGLAAFRAGGVAVPGGGRSQNCADGLGRGRAL